jgi:hypothetical protein
MPHTRATWSRVKGAEIHIVSSAKCRGVQSVTKNTLLIHILKRKNGDGRSKGIEYFRYFKYHESMGEKPLKREQKGWTPRHYEKMAQWAKEVAFLLFASLVVQELIVSRAVATPFVVVGGLATIGAYTGALYLLRKS